VGVSTVTKTLLAKLLDALLDMGLEGPTPFDPSASALHSPRVRVSIMTGNLQTFLMTTP